MPDAVYEAIYFLSHYQLEEAFHAFVLEQSLSGEFLAWVEKWKELKGIE